MNLLKLLRDADRKLDTGEITIGEYEKMIAPLKDAVPVVHGEWVWVQYDANPEIGNFHCSKCRFIPADFNMAKRHLNYCPECGAKMDGKGGDKSD